MKLRGRAFFYQEFFRRMNEEAFSVLYSEQPSRPNVPVNVLVGLEALKAGFGWSDAYLYDNYCYDLQVRYALGYESSGESEWQESASGRLISHERLQAYLKRYQFI